MPNDYCFKLYGLLFRRLGNSPKLRRSQAGRSTIISDDTSKAGGEDRKRVSLAEDYDVGDWSKKLGVSEDRLRQAVEKVGNSADDVERELRGAS